MSYLELLIHTSDTIKFKQDRSLWTPEMIASDKRSNMKQGYLQTVKPAGSPWGNMELDPKQFIRIIIPSHQFRLEWLMVEMDGEKELTDRLYRFDLGKVLTIGEFDSLVNIPYNEKEYRTAIVKAFESVDGLYNLVDWDNQPTTIKLHGSAGNFSIQEDGGGDYTTLKAGVEAQAADISAGAANAVFTITETWAAAETVHFDVDGWTTAADARVQMIATGSSTHSNGVWNATGWSLAVSDTLSMDIEEPYVDMVGLQIENTANANCLIYDEDGGPAVTDTTIDKCILRHTSSTSSGQGITFRTNGGMHSVTNTIVYKPINAADVSSNGIRSNAETPTVNLTNITVSGFNEGIEAEVGTINIKNSAVFGNNDDFVPTATINIDYCASDDAEGTNAQDLNENVGGEWTAAFTDYANGDFSVKDASSLLYNNGTNTGAPSDDIIGTSRPQATTVDIGAFELVVAGGLSIPVAMHHYTKNIRSG